MIYAIIWMMGRYMNTIGNKKLELFDMGAGSSEPTAEENVQLASSKILLRVTAYNRVVVVMILFFF